MIDIKSLRKICSALPPAACCAVTTPGIILRISCDDFYWSQSDIQFG